MSRTFTTAELQEIIAKHSRWLRGYSDGRRAVLTGADLTDAVLTGAVLTGADLTDAVLTGAVLTGADLTGADLTRADLPHARRDLHKILRRAPGEVQGLLDALRAGKINGTVYEGECACLVGTIAKVRGCHYQELEGIVPNSYRPAERLFLAIKTGDTPETNAVAKVVEGWIVEWLADRAPAAPVAP
jgi:hypothetical protein